MLNSPCMGCDGRAVTCHDKCNRYKDWKERQSEIKEQRRLYNMQNTPSTTTAKRRMKWVKDHANRYCTIHSCPSCRFWMDGWECMFRTSPARWGDMLEVLERQDNK